MMVPFTVLVLFPSPSSSLHSCFKHQNTFRNHNLTNLGSVAVRAKLLLFSPTQPALIIQLGTRTIVSSQDNTLLCVQVKYS